MSEARYMLNPLTPANRSHSHANCSRATFARQLPCLLIGRRIPKR